MNRRNDEPGIDRSTTSLVVCIDNTPAERTINSSTTLYVKDADGTYLEARTGDLVAATRRALRRSFRKGKAIRSPADTETFLIAELATEPNEIFCCLYLDLCVALSNVKLGR